MAIVDYLPVTSGSGQDSSVNVIIPHEHMVDIDKDMGYSVGEIYIRDIKDQSFIEKSMIEKLKEYPEYFLSNMSKERLENSMAEVSYLSTENIKLDKKLFLPITSRYAITSSNLKEVISVWLLGFRPQITTWNGCSRTKCFAMDNMLIFKVRRSTVLTAIQCLSLR